MEALLPSSTAATGAAAFIPSVTLVKPLTNSKPKLYPLTLSIYCKIDSHNFYGLPSVSTLVRAESTSTYTSSTSTFGSFSHGNRRWKVVVETPPREFNTKPLIIDYYVRKLQCVLDSEKDAQMCMYDASCDTHFGFCCEIDEEAAHKLSSVPGVLSVKPESDSASERKDYSFPEFELDGALSSPYESTLLFPAGATKHWLVQMERPAIGAIRKAQVVDYYVKVLTRVLRNEQDAQICIYHISWQDNFGFCCELDDECAQELAVVPGVLSIQPDENFDSDDKDYRGENARGSEDSSGSIPKSSIKTKKLFVTGLSFYTSEKTLRSAFEGFGELVEVKVIMDKISKRSKGYAFVEYTSEEAASKALREMNGKIINGWMITVDAARKNPPKYIRGQPQSAS